MLNSHIYWSVLHMSLEYSWLLVSVLPSNTEMRLRSLIWSYLSAYWRSGIVSLVELSSILMSRVSWTFGQWPMRFIGVYTGVGTFFWVVGSWTYNFWGRVEFYQGVKSFDSSSGIETVLRLIWYLWFKIGDILWTWSHFVLLLSWRKLHK